MGIHQACADLATSTSGQVTVQYRTQYVGCCRPRQTQPFRAIAISPAAGQMMQVQIPQGSSPGQTMQVQGPSGQTIQVQIPPGATSGQVIHVQLPAAQPIIVGAAVKQ